MKNGKIMNVSLQLKASNSRVTVTISNLYRFVEVSIYNLLLKASNSKSYSRVTLAV